MSVSHGSLGKKGGGGGSTAARLEDDELFKAIGGQLDADFDYSQWQRSEGGGGGTRRPKGTRHRKYADTPTTNVSSFVVSGGSVGGGRLHSADHTCRHGHYKPPKKESVMERVDREKKEEQIKILQLRIRHRKQTIAEYHKRKKQLLDENLKLKEEIESQEKDSHDKVKKLLRKYEKFRGGLSTLNDNFVKELNDAQDDRDKIQVTIAVELAGLEREVNCLDKKLRERQLELHVLLNYKDKEYPVKSLRISELHKRIEDLNTANGEEEQELQHVVETEIDKYKKQAFKNTSKLTEDVMQKALSQMHPSLRDMATQNTVMAKEVEFHSREVEDLEEANKVLEEEVKALMKNPKTNIRQQLFPEFYPTREKCTPDMEVVLDIPTQEWLPI